MPNALPDPNLLKNIPPEVLSTIPGEKAPPGVIPNFENPQTQVPVIIGVGSAFLVLACFCFFIRIYTRIAISKTWKWDDLTITLGFLFSLVYFGATVNGCVNGIAGRHTWEIHLDKLLGNASLYQNYLTVIMATPALGLIKLSLFIQYYLLFKVRRYVRISVYIGATLSGLFYIATSVTAFVMSSPWPGESILEGTLSWHYLKFAEFSIPTGIIGMLVDLVLLILPMPAVWQLQLSTSKKIGIILVFMTGGLAVAASAANLYYRTLLQNDITDASWKVGYVLIWSKIEMFAGITASSMPAVRQFFSSRTGIFSKTSRPSFTATISGIRARSKRSGHEELLNKDMAIKQWGYKGKSDEENSFSPSEETRESLRMNNVFPRAPAPATWSTRQSR
ncbi:hypothetical protein FQN49_000533 [Arthroderma sp. PD_2]|nr:hypothetical protein FQN49_000533 [Arthroderma sp. PD_2]